MNISITKLFVYLDVMRMVSNFTSYILNGKSEASINNYLQITSYQKNICNQNVKVIYLYGFPLQLSCTLGGSGREIKEKEVKYDQ